MSHQNYNPTAFSGFHDMKFKNRDGYMYTHTWQFIKSIEKIIDLQGVNTVFDIGSRDGCQSLEFAHWFPNAKVFCFEPVPENILWCKRNAELCNRITVIEKAVSDIDGFVDFHVVNNGNVGASSLYIANPHHGYGATLNQTKISVESIRAESFLSQNNVNVPQLLWMDVQGAELSVLNSFGQSLQKVKAIHTEVGLDLIYKSSTLKQDLINFMDKMGFYVYTSISNSLGIEEDVIFVNSRQ